MEATAETIDIAGSITAFIKKSINLAVVDPDEDLFDSGIVNSLFAIQLVTFIEKTFGVVVTADDLDIDNFKSVNAIRQFVERKK